jgi:arylsulfatase
MACRKQKYSRPNIVFVITDQQRFDTIAAGGAEWMYTPVLDRMSREGVRFSRMYCTSPSCSPSRASLFTGVYPHTNGVYRNDEPWPFSWVQLLAESGYRCVNVGKMHTSPFEDSFGFHERHVVENKDRATKRLPYFMDQWDKALSIRGFEKPSRITYRKRPDYAERMGAFEWELPTDLHSDNFVSNLACTWLQSCSTEEPFFLQIGIPGPHPPYDPTPEALSIYEDRIIPSPIRDDGPLPKPIQALRQSHLDVDHDGIVHLENPTKEQLMRQRKHYFANVSMIDEAMERLLEALQDKGVLDDTIVIFTSDHGDSLNDHGLSQKWSMYEHSVRVPAIVWSPGRIPGGRVVEDLTALFDFAPTILELAEAEVPEWMEAESLVPYFGKEQPKGRQYVFSEHAGDRIFNGTAFMTMVRDDQYKLVHFAETDGQLFDLSADPEERVNLWGNPKYEKKQSEMLNAILDWRISSALKTQKWTQASLRYGPSSGRTPHSDARQVGE